VRYAFWLPVDSAEHAHKLCHEHGLEFRLVRRVPQLMKIPRVKPGWGARPPVARHIGADIFQCRAIKECTEADALALNEKLGYGSVMPEAVGELVGK